MVAGLRRKTRHLRRSFAVRKEHDRIRQSAFQRTVHARHPVGVGRSPDQTRIHEGGHGSRVHLRLRSSRDRAVHVERDVVECSLPRDRVAAHAHKALHFRGDAGHLTNSRLLAPHQGSRLVDGHVDGIGIGDLGRIVGPVRGLVVVGPIHSGEPGLNLARGGTGGERSRRLAERDLHVAIGSGNRHGEGGVGSRNVRASHLRPIAPVVLPTGRHVDVPVADGDVGKRHGRGSRVHDLQQGADGVVGGAVVAHLVQDLDAARRRDRNRGCLLGIGAFATRIERGDHQVVGRSVRETGQDGGRPRNDLGRFGVGSARHGGDLHTVGLGPGGGSPRNGQGPVTGNSDQTGRSHRNRRKRRRNDPRRPRAGSSRVHRGDRIETRDTGNRRRVHEGVPRSLGDRFVSGDRICLAVHHVRGRRGHGIPGKGDGTDLRLGDKPRGRDRCRDLRDDRDGIGEGTPHAVLRGLDLVHVELSIDHRAIRVGVRDGGIQFQNSISLTPTVNDIEVRAFHLLPGQIDALIAGNRHETDNLLQREDRFAGRGFGIRSARALRVDRRDDKPIGGVVDQPRHLERGVRGSPGQTEGIRPQDGDRHLVRGSAGRGGPSDPELVVGRSHAKDANRRRSRKARGRTRISGNRSRHQSRRNRVGVACVVREARVGPAGAHDRIDHVEEPVGPAFFHVVARCRREHVPRQADAADARGGGQSGGSRHFGARGVESQGWIAVEVEVGEIHRPPRAVHDHRAADLVQGVTGPQRIRTQSARVGVGHHRVGAGRAGEVRLSAPVPGNATRRYGPDRAVSQKRVAEVVRIFGRSVRAAVLEGERRMVVVEVDRVVGTEDVGCGSRGTMGPPSGHAEFARRPSAADVRDVARRDLGTDAVVFVVDARRGDVARQEEVRADPFAQVGSRGRSVAGLHRKQGIPAPGDVRGLFEGDRLGQDLVKIRHNTVVRDATDGHFRELVDATARVVGRVLAGKAVRVQVPVPRQLGEEVVGRAIRIVALGATRPGHLHGDVAGGGMGIAHQKDVLHSPGDVLGLDPGADVLGPGVPGSSTPAPRAVRQTAGPVSVRSELPFPRLADHPDPETPLGLRSSELEQLRAARPHGI